MTAAQTSWAGHPKIKGPTEPIRMFLLTCSMIGLQFCWGTEMTYCTPYLLSLGLSKSKLSLVWVAGPLSGLVMQPVVGMISDKWTGKYGRRRPFMVGGTIGVVVCLLLLAWMEAIVGIFTADVDSRRTWTIVLAVFDIYVLDFVINVVQATCRSLVVDMLPVHKQHLGSAWVARVAGLGHLLVYGVGSFDLMATLGPTFLGDTQFKKVCVIAAIALVISQGVTCYAVEERALINTGKLGREVQSPYTILRDIWDTTLKLPPRIRAICWVTFWSWIGWFPFLFYSSTWVGEIYLRYSAPSTTTDALSEVGRVGSTSLVVFSLVSFVISIIVPYLAKSVDDNDTAVFTPRPPRSMARYMKNLHNLRLGKPSIPQAWTIANLMFAVSMVWAPTVKSVGFATMLVALCGVPWAIGGWASFALIGAEINKISSSMPQPNGRSASSYHRASVDSVELDGATLHLRHDSDASASGASQTGELAGIYLGILNLYTTLPQFIGTGISTVVFSILEPGQSPELAHGAADAPLSPKDGMSGIGVCLFVGAVCAGIAAWKCRDLSKG